MSTQSSNISLLARQIFIFNSLVTKLAGRDHEQRISLRLPGISSLQFGVMQILSEKPLTLSEIAHKMLLTPATLVPVVDRLEKHNLVVRGRDPHDRRRNPLVLTDLGREMLSKVSPFDEQDLITRSLREMGEEKTQHLNDLLIELLQRLSPEIDYIKLVIESQNRSEPSVKE
jgi:DNA-binding MarR family transcriptional regulator